MKIIITGGHVTPALAVIEEIQKRHPEWQIVFVGRKVALEGERVASAEYRVITTLGIRFLSLHTGRGNSVGSVLKTMFGFSNADWLFIVFILVVIAVCVAISDMRKKG